MEQTMVRILSKLMNKSESFVIGLADLYVTVGRFKCRQRALVAMLNRHGRG